MHCAPLAAGSNGIENQCSFNLPLMEGLLTPRQSKGSGTPTFTRASIATVSAVASGGNASDGEVIITCASGEARFGGFRRVSQGVWSRFYADGTEIPQANLKGLYMEDAETNICLYSEDFTNAAWVTSNLTVTGDSTVAPDGNTTADTLTANAGNATVLQSITSASASRVFSLWIKRKTGSGNIDMTSDNGTTWTTVAVTSSWARYRVNPGNVTNPVVGVRIVTSGDEVYVWGAMESVRFGGQAWLTSYIPTTSAAVTRAQDKLTYVFANNANTAVGAAYAEGIVPYTTAGGHYQILSFKTSNGVLRIGSAEASTTFRVTDGTNAPQKTGLTDMSTGIRRRYCSWGPSRGLAVSGDGAAEATSSFNNTIGSTLIGVGVREDGSGNTSWFGYIRRLKIWDVELTAAQLAQLGLYGRC